MARRLIECVPNFSEGRDREKVNALVEAVCSVPGVSFLGLEMDADHHRSVLTFAGPPEPVAEAALRAVGKAVDLIDLTQHAGVHPRIGAADVVPFVPIEGVTLEDCARLAHRTGMEIWRRFRVPVYFYEAAARRPDRSNLEDIRRGQFEALREEVLTEPERAPDVGDPCLHPTAGATAVGARKYLIAFNINLNTPDVEVARKIAHAIRYSSGGFRFVKAIGVHLASRHLAQVSINFTDYEQTPVHRVFEAVRIEAARYGVGIAGSEIVGLVPRRALEMAAEFYLCCENLTPASVLENRLAQEAPQQSLTELVEALMAPADRPAAASAAAASAALAAALAGTIAAQSGEAPAEFDAIRRHSFEAVERHRAALQGLAAARALSETVHTPDFEEALQRAALLSLDTAEKVRQLLRGLAALEPKVPSHFAADLASARALARAAKTSALACAGDWLESVSDPTFLGPVLERLGALESE
jgi:glutamate formiminotransferase